MPPRLFCTRPFEWLEVVSDGESGGASPSASLCCPGWLEDPYIPFTTSPLAEVWNSPKAQALRSSILDGSFRLCKAQECPYLGQAAVQDLHGGPGPVQRVDEITDPRLLRIVAQGLTILDDGPKVLNCAYDRSCNLACPSCRTDFIGRDRASVSKVTRFQETVFADVADGLTRLYVTGSGDPFASAAFRTLLGSLSPGRYPGLEVHLHTNALLWTRPRWEALGGITARITSAEISIDAASAGTYALNRGGDWTRLLANLDFVAELRAGGPLRFVALSFVVQANNFEEMPAFVDLARRYGFDGVRFAGIRNQGTFSAQTFPTLDVAAPAHPGHERFLTLLQDPCFELAGVILGDLFVLREKCPAAAARC